VRDRRFTVRASAPQGIRRGRDSTANLDRRGHWTRRHGMRLFPARPRRAGATQCAEEAVKRYDGGRVTRISPLSPPGERGRAHRGGGGGGGGGDASDRGFFLSRLSEGRNPLQWRNPLTPAPLPRWGEGAIQPRGHHP